MKKTDSKFETRNPKCETNPNVPISRASSWFAFCKGLNFEIVSGFDIRFSNFSMPQTCLVLGMPGKGFLLFS